ncbi:hypothetical protein B7992_03920 [Fibrobacter sp. UWH1]|nr:hypothetical protein B7992_03920 [Fibrobacter sp. UWH1]
MDSFTAFRMTLLLKFFWRGFTTRNRVVVPTRRNKNFKEKFKASRESGSLAALLLRFKRAIQFANTRLYVRVRATIGRRMQL